MSKGTLGKLLLLNNIELARQSRLAKAAREVSAQLTSVEQIIGRGEQLRSALRTASALSIPAKSYRPEQLKNDMRLRLNRRQTEELHAKALRLQKEYLRPLHAALSSSTERLRALDRQRHSHTCKLLRSLSSIEESEHYDILNYGAG